MTPPCEARLHWRCLRINECMPCVRIGRNSRSMDGTDLCISRRHLVPRHHLDGQPSVDPERPAPGGGDAGANSGRSNPAGGTSGGTLFNPARCRNQDVNQIRYTTKSSRKISATMFDVAMDVPHATKNNALPRLGILPPFPDYGDRWTEKIKESPAKYSSVSRSGFPSVS